MQHSLVEMAKKMIQYKSYINAPLVKDDPAADSLIKDISAYPHAFVIACFMDPHGKNSKTWSVPYKLSQALGYFDIKQLYKTSVKKFCDVLIKHELSASPEKHAKLIYDTVHKIVETPFINGDAAKIWSDRPKSSEIVLRFLDFDGCEFDCANIAPILLWRYFKVDFSDYSSIDIVPESYVIRIFERMGLIPYVKDENAARIYAICKARELNPSFPGIIDEVCWDVGKKYCKVKSPLCPKCPLCTFCENKVEIDVWAAYVPGAYAPGANPRQL